jgi:hypothetical protein
LTPPPAFHRFAPNSPTQCAPGGSGFLSDRGSTLVSVEDCGRCFPPGPSRTDRARGRGDPASAASRWSLHACPPSRFHSAIAFGSSQYDSAALGLFQPTPSDVKERPRGFDAATAGTPDPTSGPFCNDRLDSAGGAKLQRLRCDFRIRHLARQRMRVFYEVQLHALARASRSVCWPRLLSGRRRSVRDHPG